MESMFHSYVRFPLGTQEWLIMINPFIIKAQFTNSGGTNFNSTLLLFNIAMENGPFIDGLPGFTY